MAKVRINFGPDFCGHIDCSICFRDAEDKETKVERAERLEKERQSYILFASTRGGKRDYITNKFRVDTNRVPTKLEQIKCPRCGGSMVVRTNRNTQQKFLGCRIFPDCRGTRELPAGMIFSDPVKPVVQQVEVKFPPPEAIKWDLGVENEATIKGKLTVLEKEVAKKVTAALEEKIFTPPVLEPVKQVTFDDLLNRPITKMIEDDIRMEGDLLSVLELGALKEQEKKK